MLSQMCENVSKCFNSLERLVHTADERLFERALNGPQAMASAITINSVDMVWG